MLEAQLTPDTIEHFDPLIRSGIDRAIAVISPNDYTIDISAETINHLTLRRNANTTPSTTSLAAATSTASATSATASSPPSPFRSGNAHAQICASDILPHGHRPPVPSPNLLSTAHTSELGVEQEFAQSMHPTLPPSILKRPASTSVPAHPGARQQGVLSYICEREIRVGPPTSHAETAVPAADRLLQSLRQERLEPGRHALTEPTAAAPACSSPPSATAGCSLPSSPPSELTTWHAPPLPIEPPPHGKPLAFPALLALWEGRLSLDRRPPAEPSLAAPAASLPSAVASLRPPVPMQAPATTHAARPQPPSPSLTKPPQLLPPSSVESPSLPQSKPPPLCLPAHVKLPPLPPSSPVEPPAPSPPAEPPPASPVSEPPAPSPPAEPPPV